MEIAIKVGDKRHLPVNNYLQGWRDGQIIEAREDGFHWGESARRHHCIIRTQHDFWEIRGGTDWKAWNNKIREFKKFFYPVDSEGKYPWERPDGIRLDEERIRPRDRYIDFLWLLEQGIINEAQFKNIYDRSIDPGLIYIDRDLDTYLFHEDVRPRTEIIKNQGESEGTFYIGTGDSSGYDGAYATLTLFEADLAATLTGDLTGEHDGEETAIAADITFDLDTDAYLFKITAKSGEEHNGGAYGNGARINYGTFDDIFFDETESGTLNDLEISKLALNIGGSSNVGLQLVDGADTGTWTFNRLLIKGDGDSGSAIAGGSPDNIHIRNCVIYDCGGSGIGGSYRLNTSCIICNNTVIGCLNGFHQDAPSSGSLTFKNNLAQANTNDYLDDGAGFGTTACNVSEDATSPDAAYQSKDVHTNSVFLDYANDDFRLDSEGDATNLAILDDGEDLSGSFTDDIQGQTRSTWYIGASEIVTAGPILRAMAGALPAMSGAVVRKMTRKHMMAGSV